MSFAWDSPQQGGWACLRAGSRAGADLPPRLVRSRSGCQEVLKGRLELPALVGGVSAHGRGSGMRWVLKSFPTQIILWCSFATAGRTSQPRTSAGRKELNKTLLPDQFECLGERFRWTRADWRSQGHPILSFLKASTSDFSFV